MLFRSKDTLDNVNLAYDPATGINLPNTAANRSKLPWPVMGIVSMIPHNTRSELRSLQTAFTKRMSNRWQASLTYTLSWLYTAENQPFSGLEIVPFKVQPDLGNEWTLGQDDQRHRAVFNGIWAVGHGLQVSGLHYFGAGIRAASNWGGDIRVLGGGNGRLRPDGTIVPRNSFIQPAQNKTDIRVQQRIPLGNRVSLDGIAEVFNAFNRNNFTLGTAEGTPANYNKPVSGQYRTAQVGFRLTF